MRNLRFVVVISMGKDEVISAREILVFAEKIKSTAYKAIKDHTLDGSVEISAEADTPASQGIHVCVNCGEDYLVKRP